MIELTNVTKSFGRLTAVDNMTLQIPAGTVMGFLGPNGAGKTTTMRMIASLTDPDTGRIVVDGIDVATTPREVRRRLGYMPDFFGLYDDLKVWEYLDFFAAAFEIPGPKRAGLVRDVLELTDLTGKYDSYVESLSRGMKQRLCLAKTLIHDPKCLLLDEPASGLDPRARIELRELLKELQAMGKTILVSSHILTELAEMCSHVAIIEKGRLLVAGPIEDVMRRSAVRSRWMLEVTGDPEPARAFLAADARFEIVSVQGSGIVFDYSGEDDALPDLLPNLWERRIRVRQFRQLDSGVEALFLQVTRGDVQ